MPLLIDIYLPLLPSIMRVQSKYISACRFRCFAMLFVWKHSLTSIMKFILLLTQNSSTHYTTIKSFPPNCKCNLPHANTYITTYPSTECAIRSTLYHVFWILCAFILKAELPRFRLCCCCLRLTWWSWCSARQGSGGALSLREAHKHQKETGLGSVCSCSRTWPLTISNHESRYFPLSSLFLSFFLFLRFFSHSGGALSDLSR